MNRPVADEALCLCRDQPPACLCRQRAASARREAVMRGIRFGLMVAAGMATPDHAPHHTTVDSALGYAERDAIV